MLLLLHVQLFPGLNIIYVDVLLIQAYITLSYLVKTFMSKILEVVFGFDQTWTWTLFQAFWAILKTVSISHQFVQIWNRAVVRLLPQGYKHIACWSSDRAEENPSNLWQWCLGQNARDQGSIPYGISEHLTHCHNVISEWSVFKSVRTCFLFGEGVSVIVSWWSSAYDTCLGFEGLGFDSLLRYQTFDKL